ncbi:hypothetical protein [Streptomyces sp. NPDC003077]|uniref:hypothetical protein n=1 Tax=Streptomyces sp. NPDC003077 TaxID=3154443 RepID=UPI0033B204A2
MRRPSNTPADAVSDLVRWGLFSCVLVPLVLVVCGSSFAGATGTAVGLVTVTCACRALLRQSERAAARTAAEEAAPHRGRHGRTGTGAHRGGRHGEGRTSEE